MNELRMAQDKYTTMISSLVQQKNNGEITPDEFQKQYHSLREEREAEEIREMEEQHKIERLERLMKDSDLGRRFQNRTFENFTTDKTNKAIYDKCLEYAKGFKELKDEGKGLLFIGTVGTGKTHLAAAISNYIIQNHTVPVKFGSVNSLLSEIKNTYDIDSKESEYQVIKKLSDVDLLVIDDLGKEKSSDWSNSIIYTIINNRYEGYKPTIVTTNLSINQLENTVGDATVSRLIEMCEGVKMSGVDFRKTKLMK